MGDRANIAVVQPRSESRVYLYTHWDGYRHAEVLQRALQKRWRWDDPAYLTRIIFDELTKGDQGQETGYGISTTIQDNEHAILVVDTENQTVHSESYRLGKDAAVRRRWTFEEFIKLDNPQQAVEG